MGKECRNSAKLLVEMKHELQFSHKFSRMDDNKLQIKWWDYKGQKLLYKKRVIVKKEEPVEPSLEIKKEEPRSPNLEYLGSLESPDPNLYKWGPQEIWY